MFQIMFICVTPNSLCKHFELNLHEYINFWNMLKYYDMINVENKFIYLKCLNFDYSQVVLTFDNCILSFTTQLMRKIGIKIFFA